MKYSEISTFAAGYFWTRNLTVSCENIENPWLKCKSIKVRKTKMDNEADKHAFSNEFNIQLDFKTD